MFLLCSWILGPKDSFVSRFYLQWTVHSVHCTIMYMINTCISMCEHMKEEICAHVGLHIWLKAAASYTRGYEILALLNHHSSLPPLPCLYNCIVFYEMLCFLPSMRFCLKLFWMFSLIESHARREVLRVSSSANGRGSKPTSHGFAKGEAVRMRWVSGGWVISTGAAKRCRWWSCHSSLPDQQSWSRSETR